MGRPEATADGPLYSEIFTRPEVAAFCEPLQWNIRSMKVRQTCAPEIYDQGLRSKEAFDVACKNLRVCPVMPTQ